MLLLGQCFAQHATIVRGQSDSAKRCERWSNVRRRRAVKVLARLNAPSHEKNRNMLIVVVRRSVTRAVLSGLVGGSLANQPVWLRYEKQISAAARKVAGRFGAANRTL